MFVTSATFGSLDSTDVVLQTIGKVTSFSPKSGSVHGGTLITINGYQFSTDPLDNSVRIGYTDCLVEDSSETEIICRTLPRLSEEGGKDELIVYLKNSEEAVCDDCTFIWLQSGLPGLSSYSANFDNTLSEYVLTLTGTDFGATTANTLVMIDDEEQPLISASDKEVKVKIIKMLSNTTMNIRFYLPIGTPDGTEDMRLTTGITLTP